MTKADLLNKLRNLPMNAPIVFARPMDDCGHDEEADINHAFTVTGVNGLCLVLAETHRAAEMFDDAEEVL